MQKKLEREKDDFELSTAKEQNLEVSAGGSSPWIHTFTGKTVPSSNDYPVHTKTVKVIDAIIRKNATNNKYHMRCLGEDGSEFLGNAQLFSLMAKESVEPTITLRALDKAEFQDAQDRRLEKNPKAKRYEYNPTKGLATLVADSIPSAETIKEQSEAAA